MFLKNPVSCRLFSQFLESEFNHENLLFWLAVEDYKHIADPTKLPDVAKDLLKKVCPINFTLFCNPFN